MFHTISINNYVNTSDFNKGFGFYLVQYNGFNSMVDEIHYWNPNLNFWLTLQTVNEVTREFLDLFETGLPEKQPKNNTVSEEFALKMLAITRANANTIKPNEFLK